jgi:YegS/Rv2252/BmrU family lipid kinase
MSTCHAKVIVNPVAGANSTFRKWPHINRFLRYLGFKFDYSYTEGVGHAIELARTAALSGYRYLVTVGGDGTINEVANGLVSVKTDDPNTSIGVVNTGTGSDFVRSLNLPRDFKTACSALLSPNRQVIDCGVVEYYDGNKTKSRLFLNSAGAGFDAEVARATGNLHKYMRGTVPYLIGLARTLFGYQNKEVRLKIDEKEEKKKILSVVVANGRFFGGGMKVAPEADVTDGLLDIISVGDYGKLELIRDLPLIYKGEHIKRPKVNMHRALKVNIESSEKILVHADGEVLGQGPANFWLIPGALRVVVS